ncbi:MAG: hypothetical protein U1E45_03220 [Geminicoccaceae bacterium]
MRQDEPSRLINPRSLVAALLLLGGCAAAAPRPPATDASTEQAFAGPGDRAAQIRRAAQGLGWEITSAVPGLITLSTTGGSVVVAYTTDAFALRTIGQPKGVADLQDSILAQSGV